MLTKFWLGKLLESCNLEIQDMKNNIMMDLRQVLRMEHGGIGMGFVMLNFLDLLSDSLGFWLIRF
jgi:hypothetical protein